MSETTSGMTRDTGRVGAPSARLLWPLALALSAVTVAPGVSHAQYNEPLPLIDGKRWQQAVQTLSYAYPSRPGQSNNPYAVTEQAFATLARYTPQAQLVQMLKHPDPNLRPFAFWALEARSVNSDRMFNIAFGMLRDEDVARSGGGCMVSTTLVGDAVMESMLDSLTDMQRRRVLDYLLYQPNGLRLTDRVLRDWTVPARYRPTLHAMAEKGRASALIALARIGDERDVSFILSKSDTLGHAVIEVAQKFPRDEYFAHLSAIADKMYAEDWPDWVYYRAVAAYGAERAVPLMLAGLDVPEGRRFQHAGRIFDAVSSAAHEDAGFVPVLWKLWENAQRVDDATFQLMWASDKQRAHRLMRETLTGDNLEHIRGGLLVRMLRLSSGAGVDAVDSAMWTKVLDNLSYFSVDDVVGYLGKFRPRRAIEPLFARLVAKHNEYQLDAIARAILAYGDDDLRARLEEVVAANKHLRSGWAGSQIAEVFKSHGMSTPWYSEPKAFQPPPPPPPLP